MTVYSLQEVLSSRDCIAPGCTNQAEARSDRCRVHHDYVHDPTITARPMSRREQTVDERRAERREKLLTWIRTFVGVYGRTPSITEFERAGWTFGRIRPLCGNHGDAIVAAGFDRPGYGRRYLDREEAAS